MDAYERYYRRSYNAINKLIEVYKYGYNKENTLKFRQELINKYYNNPKVALSEFNNLTFTAMITLLGLNKEAIEETGKIIEYKKNYNEIDMSNFNFTGEQKLRLEDFYNSKVVSTDFDKWLSIQVNPNTDKENINYLKRVRNALLHSNFYIDEETPFMPFTKLKTKSYYEAELFNLQFQMFVFEYFGNIEALGLTEDIYTFKMLQKQIKNENDLLYHLSILDINRISYKNLKSIGEESPELLLKDSLDKNGRVDEQMFFENLKSSKNVDDIKIETLKMTPINILNTINYIDKKYGESFYKKDYMVQSSIISTHLKYDLNPKLEISNWLSHFWYLYSTLSNDKFSVSFFDGDEYATESCYPTLMVLKSYLLMYRLQNSNFDKLDYSKINFNIFETDMHLESENVDGTVATEDYFKNSFIKEKEKGIYTDDNEIWTKIVCDVIRDSLAHGNIRTYTCDITMKPMIELRDIDTKKGTIRVLKSSLSTYEKFLNSEAFSPNYCYKKDSIKVLQKSK